VRQIDRLVAVGSSAATALVSQENWIHRRVESITFPFPDRPVYRRHVSIDFTIPAGLEPAARERGGGRMTQDGRVDLGASRPPRFYVPLSLVRRWPPLPSLDLRDAAGRSVPFLTARQNAVLDSVALQGVALLKTDRRIGEDQLTEVAEIAALSSEAARKGALGCVLAPPSEADRSAEAEAHRELCRDAGFCALARALVANTLLWLRVDGWPEDREIAKFSYDVPLEPNQFAEWSSASFGLEPFVFEFEVPHLGTTSSYHCNVVAPAPLEVVRAALALFEPSDENGESDLDNQMRHDVDSTRPRPQSDYLDLYTGIAESQAKFYAAGNRTGLQGKLWVAVLIQSQGLLGGALGAALASSVILLSFTVLLCATVQLPEAAVGVLLVSPVVLGYMSVVPRFSKVISPPILRRLGRV